MFHYMNEKEVTFNVKYEIVLYTPVFNARWGGGMALGRTFLPVSIFINYLLKG